MSWRRWTDRTFAETLAVRLQWARKCARARPRPPSLACSMLAKLIAAENPSGHIAGGRVGFLDRALEDSAERHTADDPEGHVNRNSNGCDHPSDRPRGSCPKSH